MNSNKSLKKDQLHRIAIIKGHVSAIEKMIEEDKYCIDILHQSMSVQKALKKLDSKIIEEHLNHCVIDQAKRGENKKIIDELLSIYTFTDKK